MAETMLEQVTYVPTESGQAQLGDDAEPPEVNHDQWPFLSSCDDRELFGGGASCWASKQGVVVMLSELRKELTGVLIGKKTPYGRINWTEYKRVEMPFKKACRELKVWQAKSRSLDLGRAA